MYRLMGAFSSLAAISILIITAVFSWNIISREDKDKND